MDLNRLDDRLYNQLLCTYRENVCTVILPHLQQRHHHLVYLISGQNAIPIYVEHFKTNCKRQGGGIRCGTFKCSNESEKCLKKHAQKSCICHGIRWTKRGWWKIKCLHFCLSATGPRQHAESPQDISLKSIWLSRFSSKAWNKPGKWKKMSVFRLARKSNWILVRSSLSQMIQYISKAETHFC